MGVYEKHFPIGLGTSRFHISGPEDTKGIDQSIKIVMHALDCGVNYIDTSYTYSAGMAQTVLREALKSAENPVGVTVKVMHDMDKTADAARRRVELQLNAMGIERAKYFTCWFIPSISQFDSIMQKGGVYDGALKLKDEGIVDHICFSTHAQPNDIIKILKSGAFEGMTLSYNLTNAAIMQPVLNTAREYNVDVAVMNPLGGGVIAQNPDFFRFACNDENEGVIQASLRFVKAHPAVKIILSGVTSEHQVDENISTLTVRGNESAPERLNRVIKRVGSLECFCTGCDYCAGCPADIPISEIMRKRNTLLFNSKQTYNRTEPGLIENINLFYSHISANEWFPKSPQNPCIDCKQCEAKCTQGLKIVDAISDTYKRAGETGFSLSARKERLLELLVDKGYKHVGLYPNGGFANSIIELYNRFFGSPPFEWIQFNSDPKMWGQSMGGLKIHAPEDISKIRPDIIVISTYKHDKAIYERIKQYEDIGIKIVKLHRENDVPWIF